MADKTDSNGELILGYLTSDREYAFRGVKQYFETTYKVITTTATQNNTHYFDVIISMACSQDYYGNQCQYCKSHSMTYLYL